MCGSQLLQLLFSFEFRPGISFLWAFRSSRTKFSLIFDWLVTRTKSSPRLTNLFLSFFFFLQKKQLFSPKKAFQNYVNLRIEALFAIFTCILPLQLLLRQILPLQLLLQQLLLLQLLLLQSTTANSTTATSTTANSTTANSTTATSITANSAT